MCFFKQRQLRFKKNIDKKGIVSHFLQNSFISGLMEDSRILITAFKLLRYPT